MTEAFYTIKVEPSPSPGKVTATSSDGHTFTTSMCILGADLAATVTTVWSSGPGHWVLRSTIGHAAKLAVGLNRHGRQFSCRIRCSISPAH